MVDDVGQHLSTLYVQPTEMLFVMWDVSVFGIDIMSCISRWVYKLCFCFRRLICSISWVVYCGALLYLEEHTFSYWARDIVYNTTHIHSQSKYFAQHIVKGSAFTISSIHHGYIGYCRRF